MISKPYTYHLFHIPTEKHYYGVRVANKLPAEQDLWIKYFSSSKKVRKLIKEYGKDSFRYEVRKVFENKIDAIMWETRVLKRLKVLKTLRWLNSNISGVISTLGYKHTEENLKFFSNKMKGNRYSLGIKRSEESKIKQGNTSKSKNRKMPEEHKNKLKETNKKRERTLEERKNMSLAHIGKNLGDLNPSKRLDVRLKISNSLKGKPRSQETKLKLSEANRIYTYVFISPDGIHYKIYNVRFFCKTFDLNYNGVRNSITFEKDYKCWKIKKVMK